MKRWLVLSSVLTTAAFLTTGLALGQPKADCKDRAATPTTHEFQANRETLQDMKPGDKIEAKLREAPKC